MADDKISSNEEVLKSLEAAKYIAKNAQDIRISIKGIQNLAFHVMAYLLDNIDNNFDLLTTTFRRFPVPYPKLNDLNTADWLFVLHTLNFALWNPKNTKQWTVNGEQGYSGLCHAVKKAIDNGMPIWAPKYYTKMTLSEFEHIFQSDDGETSIPLIHERYRILREVGQVLLNKYKGTFLECIKLCKDDNELVQLLFDEFESYRDEAVYNGTKVRLCNKAIALRTDIWIYFKNITNFIMDKNQMMSTIFIDYCTLQVLLHFKVLRYSDELITRLNSNEPLEHGSREELEIRGCSLCAIEIICEVIQKINENYLQEIPVLKTQRFKQGVPILVDNCILGILQNCRKELMEREPFHYIKTVNY